MPELNLSARSGLQAFFGQLQEQMDKGEGGKMGGKKKKVSKPNTGTRLKL